MKDSELLLLVKERIQSNKDIYICYALNKFYPENTEQVNSLKRWISMMVGGPYSSYETWVKKHHYDVYKNMRYKNFREARLQWLDWMIAECEKAEALTPTAKPDNMFALAA